MDLRDHSAFVVDNDGKRIRLLDVAGVTPGWVVSKDVPKDFWDLCKNEVIPLKPAGLFHAELPSQAWMEHQKISNEYDGKVMFVMIPDDETMNPAQYSGGPILLDDLQRKPNDLLAEMMQFSQSGEQVKLNMKRRAAMLLLGWRDLK